MANLLHIKGSRTQIYKTLPSNDIGNDGDIILSQIQGRGVYLCSKVNGKWHISSKMEELRKIEKTSTKDLTTNRLRVLDDLFIGRSTTKITKDEAKFSSSLKIKEAANAISDTSAYGQLWVKTATPNQLYFTTDAGDDIQLTSGTTAAFVGDITGITITTDSGGGSKAQQSEGRADFSILGSNGVGVTNSSETITVTAVPGEIDHDSLNNFVANEHIDWTSASAGTIDASNYTNTTYSVMASGNSYAAGLVAAGSGTHSNQFLRKDGTWVVPTDTDTNTNQLTTFVVEDGDGTEVTISQDKEWKFVEGTGIDIDWTDTSNGSDADPYDLTITCNLEGTELKSTGESGGNKFLREDGDGTCSWQTVSGGGGISWDGSTANGVATYKDADEATVESNLTFDGTDLSIASTGKVILGGGDSYILESSADVLDLYAGGDLMLRLTENAATGNKIDCTTNPVGFTQFEPTYNVTHTIVSFNASGNKAFMTFGSGNITNMKLYFPSMSGNFVLLVKQDGSGSRTVTNWLAYDNAGSAAAGSSTVKFPGGSNPTLTTAANHVDIISIYWDADNEIAYGVASLDFQD